MKVKKRAKTAGNSVFNQLRRKMNMSQEEMAKLLGITVTTLSRWENGHTEPSLNLKQIKNLAMLMRGLNLTYADLPDSFDEEIKVLELINNNN